jgi:hypothetical protein
MRAHMRAYVHTHIHTCTHTDLHSDTYTDDAAFRGYMGAVDDITAAVDMIIRDSQISKS